MKQKKEGGQLEGRRGTHSLLMPMLPAHHQLNGKLKLSKTPPIRHPSTPATKYQQLECRGSMEGAARQWAWWFMEKDVVVTFGSWNVLGLAAAGC